MFSSSNASFPRLKRKKQMLRRVKKRSPCLRRRTKIEFASSSVREKVFTAERGKDENKSVPLFFRERHSNKMHKTISIFDVGGESFRRRLKKDKWNTTGSRTNEERKDDFAFSCIEATKQRTKPEAANSRGKQRCQEGRGGSTARLMPRAPCTSATEEPL